MRHLYGLIGYPLSHSFSKGYFTEKFEKEKIADHFYELFPLEHIEELPALLKTHSNLRGLNVTIPYKQAVIPFLDEVDPEAATVGAVNTIRIHSSGKLTGYNSDLYGFTVSLQRFIDAQGAQPESALVLGTGGAAKAVMHGLRQMGIRGYLVSRSPEKGTWTYADLNGEIMHAHPLIVNTTPLGMAPHTSTCPPIPYAELTGNHFLYDLVYNPEKTLFLSRGEAAGCPIKNGLEMLYLQAERSWAIWNS